MVPLNSNWFQKFHYRSLSKNGITSLLVTQKMVDSKRQEMQKIISLSVILHYVHYCHPNFKKYHQYTKSYVVVSVVYMTKVYIPHYYHVVIIIKKLKDQRNISQSIRSEEKSHHIYETYKNTFMPHGRRIYTKASDMAKAKNCAYPHTDHALPHLKCVLRFCYKCRSVNISDQETDDQYSNTSTSIRFHIYHLIAYFKHTHKDFVK